MRGANDSELPAERVREGLGYGFERLWERVIGLADRAGGLLYVLAIKGDFKRHQVALDSRRLPFILAGYTLEVPKFSHQIQSPQYIG